ncbi:MAG: amino acid--tRNA ligase-related protein [Pseudomonadota bacterium]|nr:amino acid--tRNA ligase-related protein [Pseudomonadota bacterium]
MTNTYPRSARIVDIQAHRAVLMIGDVTHIIDWPGVLPRLGDIWSVSSDDPPRPLVLIGGSASGAWNASGDGMRWRVPGPDGKSRMSILHDRHHIRRAVRDFFDGQGFIEVDLPLLIRGTSPDAAIVPFTVADRYLSFSTEFQMKRLEVAGIDRLYSMTQNFRAGEAARCHNPEFTMVEWECVAEPLESIERQTEGMICAAHNAIGGQGILEYGGHRIDLTRSWPRIPVAEALERHLHVKAPDFESDTLLEAVRAAGIEPRADQIDDSALLFTLAVDAIEPALGCDQPIFLCDWPSFQTSSAHVCDNGLTERSELYIAGIELANGFSGVIDPVLQAQTFEQQQARRVEEGLAPVEIDTNYLEALRQGMGRGAGSALGLDRLVMLLTGQTNIRNVLTFAWDEL